MLKACSFSSVPDYLSDPELEARDTNRKLSFCPSFSSNERGRHINFVNLGCVGAEFFMPGRNGLNVAHVHNRS